MEELKSWPFFRAVIAEFVATLLFLYVTVATVIGHKNQANQCDGVRLLGISWAIGGMIFVLVYCTAGISAYTVVQCLGGICGIVLVKALMKHYYYTHGGGANSAAHEYSKGTALGAEIVGTFLLVYTVFSATDPKSCALNSHVPVLAPLPIGFAVFMVHLATIPITSTGIGINPARSFAAAAAIYNNDNDKVWDDQPRLNWIFWVGPSIRALLAAAYHQYVLRASSTRGLGSFRSHLNRVA